MDRSLAFAGKLVIAGLLGLAVTLTIGTIVLVCDAIPFAMSSQLPDPFTHYRSARTDLILAGLCAVTAFLSGRAAFKRIKGEL
jgi:hypothetical protein